MDIAFLSIFTVELTLQAIYFLWKLFQDPWLVFDLVIISLSWGLDSLQIIRAFRIFRAFRLITRIKVLRDLVVAIGQVIPRMTAIGFLLALIFYIFAVLFTELFGDLELGDSYFTTLDASLFTCYELMTLEWADLARDVMAQRSWAWAPFLAFIFITGFIVFNLVIAVVCDAVAIVDRVAREREARKRGERIETPEESLAFAQAKIDELTLQIGSMLRSQRQMHQMLEMIAMEVHGNSLDGTRHRIRTNENGSWNPKRAERTTSPPPTRAQDPR
jgi:hypothetical protein